MVDYNTNSVVYSSYFDFPISPEIMKLTHISNEQLKNGDKDYQNLKHIFARIAKTCSNPVLVAHNGNSFDHQFLLIKNIIKSKDFGFNDSRPIISQFY